MAPKSGKETVSVDTKYEHNSMVVYSQEGEIVSRCGCENFLGQKGCVIHEQEKWSGAEFLSCVE